MLQGFLNNRKQLIQKLINKGFKVEIKFEGEILEPKVIISIVHENPWFLCSGSYWIREEKDHSFTAALLEAEKFDTDKTIVEDFVKSLSK